MGNSSTLHYGAAALPDEQCPKPAPWPPPQWLEQSKDSGLLCDEPAISWTTSAITRLKSQKEQLLQFNIIPL